jgi:hypothetical protein
VDYVAHTANTRNAYAVLVTNPKRKKPPLRRLGNIGMIILKWKVKMK